MHRLAALLLVVAFALVAVSASSAQAQCGNYGGFGAYAFNPNAYGNGWWPYTQGYVPVPPYFALHPPVYYSYPVSRTYGTSPYPYLPAQEPVYQVDPAPQEIVNPYVTGLEQPADADAPSTDRAISHGQLVINPYVDQPGTPRVAEID